MSSVVRVDALVDGILQSKTLAPPILPNTVDRPRLTRTLANGLGRLGLVVAPAGYGKSTLLAQWAATARSRVAWVALAGDDSDPARFWAHVLAAYMRAAPEAIEFPRSALAVASIDEVVTLVANWLWRLEEPVTLVLDDYHEVRSEDVDRSMARLVTHLPAGSSVVISSRHDPLLAVARLRAAEQMTEIRQRDLRFDLSEAQAWIDSHAFDLSREQVASALRVTEGWPAAFALAVRSAMRSGDPAAAVTAFGGDHRHVASYIREEVLDHLGEDLPVLEVAAVCPRVCAELVDHALETSGGREALLRIEGSGLLLESLDSTQTWFRLHRLVAEYVRAAHDRSVDRWLVRAGEWFAEAGYQREALDLMLEAGRHSSAAEMINRSWLRHVRRGEHATLRRDLARVRPEAAAQSAPFLVTRAWLYASEGRRHDAIADLDRAAAVADSGPLPDGCPSVEVARAVINSLFVIDGGFDGAMASARRADELVGATSDWRVFVELGIGYSSFMTGQLSTARAAFEQVYASPDPLLRAVAVGWSTVIDVLLANLTSARARLDEWGPLWTEDPPLARVPAMVVAQAAVDCADGNPIRAASALDECWRTMGSSDPTDRLEVLIWLAAADAAIGRSERARKSLRSAARIVAELGGSGWHSGRVREIEERLGPATMPNGRDPGLTERETRILQLLTATHLSQREIGAELGVSFNTIKSHVKAIYVKLGAKSREEASQIARVRGFV